MGTSTDSNEKRNASLEKDASVDEKHQGVKVSVNAVDTAAGLVYGEHGELDPAEALRVRRKIDHHILPLMCVLYWMQFMDKTTLGSSAILGITQSTHITTNQYNWLGTIFYLSYLVFEFPQNLALQRFPVAKWMSINIFVWSVALCSHAACKSFGGLFVVRLILGMCEGSITAGFMIVSSMFYTRTEQTLRVGYWCAPYEWHGYALQLSCYLTIIHAHAYWRVPAQIVLGFISFGALHIKTPHFEPWQWLMIITGILTFLTSLSFWFFFPDSPTNAWFLTPEERAIAVMRIKANQTGVENKHFKKEQMIEALTDPKTWLFALFSALDNVPNSLTNQRQIIVSSFGFTTLQTTLLTCVDGVIEIVTIWTGVNISARLDSRAWVAFFYFIPNVLGTILVNVLPWSNKIGLLFSVWTAEVGTTGFVLSLSWVSAVTAGHTKRVTTNAIMLGAYCIGNAAGPFMWQARYKPRNHVPWTVIGVCYACCMFLVLVIRYLLIRENKRRDAEPAGEDGYDEVYVERLATDGSGKMERVRIDKEFLDLTDRQNRDFRYVY
ncbi:MFS general substrate transporter [Mycena sanguinolenta]|uniref:MFS general substrate transporter n=1 Tax=Mycena sanguinolenta TaxID=230812 RepID=A0A8H7CQV0_9AGAR|nr:MFS general substrate transporter [Mycena sanguinolenta]